jgi:hypothetical protein
VQVNFDQIDEIHIKRIGKSQTTTQYMYRIIKPCGYENFVIDHDRSLGHVSLVHAVFDILNRQQHKTEEMKEWEKQFKAKKKKSIKKT